MIQRTTNELKIYYKTLEYYILCVFIYIHLHSQLFQLYFNCIKNVMNHIRRSNVITRESLYSFLSPSPDQG